jgi:hypothetical protein
MAVHAKKSLSLEVGLGVRWSRVEFEGLILHPLSQTGKKRQRRAHPFKAESTVGLPAAPRHSA